MDDSAHVRICERQMVDWQRPQFTDPTGEAWTTAVTDGDAEIELAWFDSLHERPFRRTLLATVANGSLKPGERIEITFGDTSGGGPGRRAQTFREPEAEFQVHVDPFGAQRYFPVPDHPFVCVLGDVADGLELRCGSQFEVGESIALHVRAVDRWGNTDEFFKGPIALSADAPVSSLPATVIMSAKDRGCRVIEGISAAAPARIHFHAQAKGLPAVRSNPLHVSAPGSLANGRVRWGDLHGQSRESVGTLDAADYLRFARDDAFVEFVGHQANDFQITNDFLSHLGTLTSSMHQPGRFVPFFGWEWSGNTTTGGDRNVHFLGDSGPLHRSSHALLRDVSDADQDACPVSELFDRLRARDDVLLVPHVGGRYANLDFHDPALEPVIEIHSAHGTFEWLGRDARRRGLKVGYFCGSDVHVGRPGAARPSVKTGEDGLGVCGGLAAIHSPQLNRESIFDALRRRDCYGTTGTRILLIANANGAPIGSSLTPSAGQDLTIAGIVDGTAPIQSVELLRDWEPVAELRPRASAQASTLRVIWAGAASRGRRRSVRWHGGLTLSGNEILSARSVGFDHLGENITLNSANALDWNSATEGDLDGVELTMADSGGQLSFAAGPVRFELDLANLGDERIRFDGGPIDCRVEVERVQEDREELQSFEWVIPYRQLESAGYHLRVTQTDCHMAWSSPFYVELP